jgi:hypothetical protein
VSWPKPVGLAAYAVGVAAVTILGSVGAIPAWSGMVHLVALPPLDIFADARWLIAHAPSHPAFVAGLLATVAVRTAVLALLVGGRRPAWRLALSIYAAALVPALVAAQLGFVAHAALYSRLFWAAVTLTAVTAAVLSAAPWSGADRLGAAVRAAWGEGLRIWVLLGYGVVLVTLGSVAEHLGGAAAVAAVPLGGVLTIAAIARLRAEVAPHAARQLAAAGVALVVAWALVVGTRGTPVPDAVAARDGSLLVMSGINSASGEGAIFELEPQLLGFTCEQKYYYSYAGTGDGQPRGDAACPIRTGAPYEPDDTQRPFAGQVALLVEQAADLPAPVTVIAHSQAAWVAWDAAAAGDLPTVDHLVLLGPFPDSPVGYPPPGEEGPGRVGGDGFRALEPLIQAVDFHFTVDAPLAREVLAVPDAATGILSQALPDEVAVLSVTAAPDLALMPEGWRIDGARDACPVREAHPYLPLTPAFHREANTFLDGAEARGCSPWPDVLHRLARPFGIPPV